MSREGTVSRLTIPIADDMLLSVMALCYARGPRDSASEPCDVWIYAFGSGADSFGFTNLDFTVDVVDPPSAQIELQAGIPDFGEPPQDYETRTWPAKAWVDLSYEDVPQQFMLNLPPFTVDSDSYQAPSVTFTFTRNVDIVPWGW
jgi:hypothetical protein